MKKGCVKYNSDRRQSYLNKITITAVNTRHGFGSGAESNCSTQSLAIKIIAVYFVIEKINACNNYSFHLVRLEDSLIYLSYVTKKKHKTYIKTLEFNSPRILSDLSTL